MTDRKAASDWRADYEAKRRTPAEAVRIVKDGDTVYVGTSTTMARELCLALYDRKEELRDVTICSSTSGWMMPFFYDAPGGAFSILTYFAGAGERESMRRGNCRYTSLHLSEIPHFCRTFLHGSVAFLEVSPPDENGFMSYGCNGVAMHDFLKEEAAYIVLSVNRRQPYLYGERNVIHVSEADALVETDLPIQEDFGIAFDGKVKAISEQIVEQIPDGATIQLGLGGISEAIGQGLRKRNDLGVHSEMFSNSMMQLMKEGVITNRRKTLYPGKSVATFLYGTEDLYRFADYNEELWFAPYTIVNNPYVIAQNDNMISINAAMSVDLFGQVAADHLAGREQSGVGGQVDFVRGAQLSKGGKSFIALTSAFEKNGVKKSRITASFPPGTAVTTSRQDVQYVVTEYGCVNLKNLTMQERARALISLADPEFREELQDQARELGII